MKKNKNKKIIRNLILFVILIWITFEIILKGQNINDIISIVMNAKKEYLLIGVASMIIYFSCEAINVGRILRTLKEKSNFLKNFKYTLIGFFFSSITPAASGGQPMEIYYMHKDKISVANSTLALLIQLCSFQIVTIIFGTVSVFINYKYLNIGLIYLFIIGIFLNSIALMLLLIGIFSKRLSMSLISFAVKVLKFFKIKHIEERQKKLEDEVSLYQESALYIKAHKTIFIKSILTTFMQMMAYYSIPYWVYCSFGLTGFNIFKIITMQAVLYATVSGIPSPGAVGVSEGAFIEIFKVVFSSSIISSAMLLNRGISFYLFVIISSIIVISTVFKTKKSK